MAGGLHVGVNEIIYRNTATYASPVWSAITIARDVSITLDKSMAEVKARIATWAMNLPAMKSLGIEFDILGDKSVAAYDVLRDAWLNDTMIEFAVADGAIASTGTEYLRAQTYLSGFSLDEKLEEAETAKVTAKLAYSATVFPTFTNVP